jgi:hypothetical protein
MRCLFLYYTNLNTNQLFNKIVDIFFQAITSNSILGLSPVTNGKNKCKITKCVQYPDTKKRRTWQNSNIQFSEWGRKYYKENHK